ncbi:MAG: hypothetical protein ACREQ9_07525 [Candidatus Binatia bacterium]
MNEPTKPIAGDDPRQRLAKDLADALEDLLFNLEHGIPWKVVHELDRIAAELGEIDSGDRALRAEIDAFRSGVNELFADRDAAEEVIVHGERIAAILRGVR